MTHLSWCIHFIS